MLKLSIRSWTALVGTAALFVGGLASAEEIYTWRTQDGGYAFTDDQKAIPPRYRESVEVRRLEGLEGYERFHARQWIGQVMQNGSTIIMRSGGGGGGIVRIKH